jgi:ring-1,2-phenylacetyl-CoA epoxidase subunit PaaE
VGDSLDVMEPQGRFGDALKDLHAGHLLFMAGGSGITPILSLLRHVLQARPQVRCTLLYSNRRIQTTMFLAELEELQTRFASTFVMHTLFSREPNLSPSQTGRFDRARIKALLDELAESPEISKAFICGPQSLNEEAQAALQTAGLSAHDIQVERFSVLPLTDAGKTEDAGLSPVETLAARVSVLHDGVTYEVDVGPDDASVLDAALREGVDLPYSCKNGICATCRATLIEGEVHMDRMDALELVDLEAGLILTCQARPLTDRLVVSFDDE